MHPNLRQFKGDQAKFLWKSATPYNQKNTVNLILKILTLLQLSFYVHQHKLVLHCWPGEGGLSDPNR